MWSRAARNSSNQAAFSRFQRAAAPLAFAFGTIVSIRPVSTLMEAATTTTPTANASTSKDDNETSSFQKRSLHSYGRAYFPRDIYYNVQVKDALAKLRTLKRDQVPDSHPTEASSQKKEDNNNGDNYNDAMEPLHSCGKKDVGTLTLIGYKGGPLIEQINQDRAVCIAPYTITPSSTSSPSPSPPPKKSRMPWSARRAAPSPPPTSSSALHETNLLVGVFDGHAQLGERVSEYVVNELPRLLASKIKTLEATTEQICKALVDTFVELDRTAPAEISGGCTASVVLKYGSKVFFANAGDSRSFLVVYRERTQSVEIIYITREDKPDLDDERQRVESRGGKVYIPLYGTSRVLYTDPVTKVQSGLAMSRSIGDWEVGHLGVIPDPLVHVVDIPELVETKLQEDGQSEDDVHVFAVSATDGITDFANPTLVAHTIALSLYDKEGPHLLTALEQLIYFAAQGWEQSKQGRYRDDMSIAVAQLRIPPKHAKQ